MSRPHPEPLTVDITDLGRVAHARVQLRPLTLLVGENNSGKSYVASLLWALHQVPAAAYTDTPEWAAWEAAFGRVLADLRAGDVPVFGEDEDISSFSWLSYKVRDLDSATLGLARQIWEPLVANLVQQTFRTASLHPRVTLSPSLNATRLGVARFAVSDGGRNLAVAHGDPSRLRGLLIAPPETHGPASHGALHAALGLPLGGPSRTVHDPSPHLYLPASRTGFVQLLPELVDKLLGAAVEPDRKPLLPGLTAPVVQFLRFLVNPGPSAEQQPDLVELIESRVLQGRVRSDAGVGRYVFVPAGTDLALPMGRASAVVSELMPLLAVLQLQQPPDLLVYEEPEAHLHPRLQRVVAQVLVRMVRAGTRVIVTTHSDTFVQQINNFVKLGTARGADLRDRLSREAGSPAYTDDDQLAPDEVGAYEFRFRDDGRSEVVPLEVFEDGVVMPSFNEELVRLARETVLLDEATHNDEGDPSP